MGLAAPKGTPRATIEKLARDFGELYRDPKFVSYLEKQAVVPAAAGPEDFAEFLTKDREIARSLIKTANTPPAEYRPEP